jgi:hypothetical protein
MCGVHSRSGGSAHRVRGSYGYAHVATLLGELNVGNDKAVAELVVSLYSELRRLASHYFSARRDNYRRQSRTFKIR